MTPRISRIPGIPGIPAPGKARLAAIALSLGLLFCLSGWFVPARAEDAANTQPAPDAQGATPAAKLQIFPPVIALHGASAGQTLLVQRVRGSQVLDQVRKEMNASITDESIARIEGGRIAPLRNGVTRLRVSAQRMQAEAEIRVTGMDQPFEWNFRNHVQPVLARFGCSSGACHGAAAGKNDFRLSLRGYDDAGDYASITRHAAGRRVNLVEPHESLLLLKSTATLPHKGGRKISPDSPDYRVLSGWIAAGAPGPRPEDPRVERISVLPEAARLKPGMEQQIVVMAHFSDGAVQDVTRWAKFTSADTSVAAVDDDGLALIRGSGQGAITAWYASRIAISTLVSPYSDQTPEKELAASPRVNLIDDLVLEKLRELNLPPSGQADDAQFLRRAFLDTLGMLPTIEEARAFAADRSPDKRDKLIESLLARPEFIDYWAYRWSDLLLVNSFNLPKENTWAYYNWIREKVAANTPWDEMARQLVTAQGSSLENGAANFYLLHDDPTEMSETVSVAFLGMSINCAKCHNHPMEKWTNDQYFGMANLFSRVRSKIGPAGSKLVFADSSGELIQPLTGRPRPPQPLDGTALGFDEPGDRRQRMGQWLTDRANPYFTRAIVNRVWANFMGVGLVESVDDMRMTNPASNEKLLSALAAYLADQKYDLKSLMRLILRSGAYQRSSEMLAANAGDRRFYSRYYPRRLRAEVMLDALSSASGAPTAFAGYPAGWRALQLPDSNIDSYFLKSFGRPERQITCECERTDSPSMTQVLHLANGSTMNEKLTAKANRIQKLLEAGKDDAAIVTEAYWAALSRAPTAAELEGLVKMLRQAPAAERRQAVEDLFWGILSSKAFLFNH